MDLAPSKNKSQEVLDNSSQGTPQTRPLVKWVIGLFFGLVLLLVLGGIALNSNLMPVSSEAGESILVRVEPNSTSAQIAQVLYQNRLIRSPGAFLLFSRLRGLDSKLQAGEYYLSADMSTPEILQELVKGHRVYFSFTIPEGYTIKQIAALLEDKGLIDKEKFLRLVREGQFEYEYLADLPAVDNRLEGYLFPATYQIPMGLTEERILRLMLERMGQELTPEVEKRAAELGMTWHQVLTLASIIEREAQKPEERGLVSAVFHNRLKKNMRLEACSTVQYLLEEPKPKLYYKDLENPSPYNTYRHDGLPPGPIASPGKASIQAALNPEPVDYLFFVAKEDGSHHFSRTLAEHDAAVARYGN